MMDALPLFPLQCVLFPDGRRELRVFEKRYMDMAAGCMKDEQPFGVCLIKQGHEVGAAANPHRVGTSAYIKQWAMPQSGILALAVRGRRRFRVRGIQVQKDQLILAHVEWLPTELPMPVPDKQLSLVRFLRQILKETGAARYFAAPAWDQAGWVANRLAEALPIANRQRQALLEMDDPVQRLERLAGMLKHG